MSQHPEIPKFNFREIDYSNLYTSGAAEADTSDTPLNPPTAAAVINDEISLEDDFFEVDVAYIPSVFDVAAAEAKV